ncbi:hypothetical protein [Candidatus Phytoplasma sp. AldY-WA1]|uniref:hypothetical protein n=1 Tax=Candidatus Phytoplasma sp. AldY-WA1 TaxID=2852100 RepID=UPI0025502AB5|nr:hypothetical protein [Candidatus Phytoplasma sp. AldY-WA1]
MQIIEQINNQTNNQTLFLEDLTMNNKDTHLVKNTQKTFQLINKNQSLSIFEKEKFIKEFCNNLFFFKTTDYGIGAYSNCLPLHMYQLQSRMQARRLQNLKERKIMFTRYKLRALGYDFSTLIEKNFERYYEIANNLYQQKNKKEILKFIKTKIKENEDLQELFKNEVSNPDEYFLILNKETFVLVKITLDIKLLKIFIKKI